MVLRVSIVMFLALFATASISLDTLAKGEIENLLNNPDFELGTEGWTLGCLVDGAAGSLSIDKKENPPAGEGQVMWAKIDGVGNDAWEPEIHSPSFDVEIGKMYTVSLWAKTEPQVKRTIGVKFEQLDTWVGPSQEFLINDQWAEYHFSPIMTMDSPPAVVIHIQFNFLKDDVWFSHFKVYEGKYVEEELGGVKRAVTPVGRLTTTWGQIRSR